MPLEKVPRQAKCQCNKILFRGCYQVMKLAPVNASDNSICQYCLPMSAMTNDSSTPTMFWTKHCFECLTSKGKRLIHIWPSPSSSNNCPSPFKNCLFCQWPTKECATLDTHFLFMKLAQ